MLVLSRKVGERVLLGENIRITIVRVSGGGVRLGIEAPTDVAVVREEVAKSDFVKLEVSNSEVVLLKDANGGNNGSRADADSVKTPRRRPK